MCGETRCIALHLGNTQGLSPRVRGNPSCYGRSILYSGSIPTCAGEPSSASPSSRTSRVYPHVCGGTLTTAWLSPSRMGLSPRVRGNPSRDTIAASGHRSIPTCAGEPRWQIDRSYPKQVYPHVCGGTLRPSAMDWSPLGLSPRVRGNQTLYTSMPGIIGSIPTCAGEPNTLSVERYEYVVYPHVCGGTRPKYRLRLEYIGLSPRVRGNRKHSLRLNLETGSIPTCAGEPR